MNRTRPRILLVDDHQTVLEAFSLMLVEEYEPSVALSGAEALALAQRTLPDLILLDVLMPEMDGLETLRRLRASAWGKDIPAILVTSTDCTETQIAGLQAGADDFISKNVAPAVLRARVRNLLAHRRTEAACRTHRWVIKLLGPPVR